MDIIRKYFPKLTDVQYGQLEMLHGLYSDWNSKINVISRKDIQNLYERHVLHSLGVAKLINFKAGTKIMDLGTGGGFPGIPLAIVFPETEFLLVDSVGKKIRVCMEVAEALGLKNVTCANERGENEKGKFHFVVSRAVMPLPELIGLVRKNIAKEQFNALPNGLICLKGGDIEAETNLYKKRTMISELSEWFDEECFLSKKGVYVDLSN